MARADEYLAMLDDPEAPSPSGDHPADEALLQILVHLACSDGVVQDEELELFLEVLPGRDARDVLALVARIASTPIDLEGIAAALTAADERAAALRFAARLAWADDHLDAAEESLLTQLAHVLELSDAHLRNALDQILRQPTGEVSPDHVTAATAAARFTRADLTAGPLFTELADIVPAGAVPVARILVEGVEAIGLYDVGLAAHFAEGPAFVGWSEVAYYTRVPMLGAAVRVVTTDQRTLSIADRRLGEVGALLDRVYDGTD